MKLLNMVEEVKKLDEYWNAILAQDHVRAERIENEFTSNSHEESSLDVVETLKQLHETRLALFEKTEPVIQEFSLGSEIGQYQVIDLLGSGGMGTVYCVRQKGLNRLVALKYLHQRLQNKGDAIRRFQEEASTIAKLRHSNILNIHEIGAHDGNLFYTMDLISGSSLAEYLGRRPINANLSARLMVQVSEAIQYAHEQKILHRDIKPSNILLDESMKPYVSDFGLALDFQAEPNESRFTQTGAVVGTPNYLSPEQAIGDLNLLAPTIDVYGLGATLYEMVCGKPPFSSGNLLCTFQQIVEDEPLPPKTLNSGVPIELSNICLKCLEKEPKNRYQSAAEFRDDLQRYLDGKPVLAQSPSKLAALWKWSRKNKGFAFALASGSVLGLALVLFSVLFAVTVNSKNNEINAERRSHTETKIQNILHSDLNSLQLIISDLDETDSSVIDRLKLEFLEARNDFKTRFNAGIAISTKGHFKTKFIIDNMDGVFESPTVCKCILAAIKNDPLSLSILRDSINTCKSTKGKAKRIVLLAHLGDLEPWKVATDNFEDPTLKSEITQVFANWHGDLGILAVQFGERSNERWIWSFCESLCFIDNRRLNSSSQIAIKKFLSAGIKSKNYNVAKFSQIAISRLFGELAVVPIPESEDRRFLKNGIVLVRIASGTAKLGRFNPLSVFTDYPPHDVTISEPYFISDTEITIEQFREYALEELNLKKLEEFQEYFDLKSDSSESLKQPMCRVSWFDAVKYCNWLSKKNGFQPVYSCIKTKRKKEGQEELSEKWVANFEANGFRLPTEAEFEFADRNRSVTPYFFGEQQALFDNYAIASTASRLRPLPVRSKLPNSNGLHDMLGNVWEWVHDKYDKYDGSKLIDPKGPMEYKKLVSRMYRGGGVQTMVGIVDSEARGHEHPSTRYSNLGFRVVIQSPSKKNMN